MCDEAIAEARRLPRRISPRADLVYEHPGWRAERATGSERMGTGRARLILMVPL